jgi:hypothetical protein
VSAGTTINAQAKNVTCSGRIEEGLFKWAQFREGAHTAHGNHRSKTIYRIIIGVVPPLEPKMSHDLFKHRVKRSNTRVFDSPFGRRGSLSMVEVFCHACPRKGQADAGGFEPRQKGQAPKPRPGGHRTPMPLTATWQTDTHGTWVASCHVVADDASGHFSPRVPMTARETGKKGSVPSLALGGHRSHDARTPRNTRRIPWDVACVLHCGGLMIMVVI